MGMMEIGKREESWYERVCIGDYGRGMEGECGL